MANPANPAGNAPYFGNAPNVPTAAQLAQLAVLQAAAATAILNFHNARAGSGGGSVSYKSLHGTMLVAMAAVAQYQLYIYGGQKPGIYDEGGPSVT